ncbi:MAG: rRNA cytosine-C5-methyltransferase [Armatimonadaceae bacterium]
MNYLPQPFLQRIKNQLGETETAQFVESLGHPATVSVRRNPYKPAPLAYSGRPIPWCEDGLYLDNRPEFIFDPLWHAGAYYVQEPSSMLLDRVVRQSLDIRQPLSVLDLCAAPGGKATLLAALLSPESVLVANDAIRSRVAPLTENLIRWGNPNVLVSNHDPEELAPVFASSFDLVVVDAPCSGEGLFRKDARATTEWSVENTAICAARQTRILEAAQQMVADGGFLFYSTCTYNPLENDAQIRVVLETGGWETVSIALPPEWGIAGTEQGWQCWSHRCEGEGFYFSLLRRTGCRQTPWGQTARSVPSTTAAEEPYLEHRDRFARYTDRRGNTYLAPHPLMATLERAEKLLPRIRPLLRASEVKGKEIVPIHEQALSLARSAELPQIVLDRESAVRYLRKDPFDLPEGTPNGWTLATYAGLGLGWLKVMPGRINNYLPTEWRIRKLPNG